MLRSIIRNLLSNAMKFSFKGGTMALNYSVKNEFVVVSVSDSGTGISKYNLINLFHITKKKSKPGTKNKKGTGLGLILVKEFVELNGGTVWVESEKNKGSTFYFTVPRPGTR